MAGWTGLESDQRTPVVAPPTEYRALATGDTPSMGAGDALNEAPLGRTLDHAAPPHHDGEDVEAALVKAIGEASAAGRFDVVALLAGELHARRLARGGIVSLDAKRRQRGG